MSAYASIGAALGSAALATAKATGITITFTHRALTAVTLYATVVSRGIGVEELYDGHKAEVGVMLLDIPVQTGLAVMSNNQRPISDGDKIEYPASSGRYWRVAGSIEERANGYVYRVPIREEKAHTVGVPS